MDSSTILNRVGFKSFVSSKIQIAVDSIYSSTILSYVIGEKSVSSEIQSAAIYTNSSTELLS